MPNLQTKRIQNILFFAGLAVISGLVLFMVLPFLIDIVWAAILASIFYPIYIFFVRNLKYQNLAAVLTLLCAVIIVIVPITLVLGLVVNQAISIFNTLSQPETIGSIQAGVQAFLERPTVQYWFGEINVEESVRTSVRAVASSGFEIFQSLARNIFLGFFHTFIILYAFYFFLKDGPKILNYFSSLFPLGPGSQDIFYKKFTSTSKATLKGTILLGILQGAMGGLLFFLVGIPSAAFWGVIMTILSIIPAVGVFLVWIPFAIYMFVVGNAGIGLALVVGGIIISFTDNLLRPPLVGRDTQMPSIVIFFSTIGGLAYFGISGIVLGPILAAFLMALLDIYRAKYVVLWKDESLEK